MIAFVAALIVIVAGEIDDVVENAADKVQKRLRLGLAPIHALDRVLETFQQSDVLAGGGGGGGRTR